MKKFIETFNKLSETHQIDCVKRADDDRDCFVMLFNRTLEFNNGEKVKYFNQIFDNRVYVVQKGDKTYKFLICINVPRDYSIGLTAVGMEIFSQDREYVLKVLKPLLCKTFPKEKGYKKYVEKI